MSGSGADIETVLRQMLLGLAAATCLATTLELGLLEHVKGWVQRIPFGLAALIWIAVGLGLRTKTRKSVYGVRALAGLVLAGAILGMYQHFVGNLAFAMEIESGLTRTEAAVKAARGVSPLLAPGALGLASFLCLAAMYRHPAVVGRE